MGLHTIWKGAITFGLVHIPIKMHAATEEKEINFRQLHKECGSPISHKKNCTVCEKEIDMESIIRGFEYETNRFVIFEKEELEKLTDEKNKWIKVMNFINADEVDPVYFQKTYYLSPESPGITAYNLLMQAMTISNKAAICNVTIRSKNNLCLLRVKDKCVVMEVIYYPDEIRNISEVPNLSTPVEISEKELSLAQTLIDHLTTNFNPETYKNEHRVRVLESIKNKINGQEIIFATEQNGSNVSDLMSALQASLENIKLHKPDKEKVKRSSKGKKKENGLNESAS
jgi:DNA end-binding protein Ku